MSSLAARHGYASWKDIYDHPNNADLKRLRPNPNVLAPGDEVDLPERGPAKSVSAPVEHLHKFKVKLPKVKLRVAIVDRAGKPQEGKRFVVNVGAREIKGATASGGLVEVEVRATESTARLRVWLQDDGEDAPPTIDRELALGHIDPIDTISGVQKRLSNLGYRCTVSDEIAPDLDDPTLVAVRSFRAKNGLPEVDRPKPKEPEDDSHDADAKADDDADGRTDAPEGPTEDEIATYVEKLMDDAFRKKLLAAYQSSGAA